LRYPIVPASIGLRVWLAIGISIAALAAAPTGPADAREGNRTLKLYFGHTGERGEFTFKKNGRYDRGELEKINRLLRDWRRNEPAKLDPQLLDLVWSIYRQTGSHEYIHVVSAYRSPATNDMLRKRSSGVAKNSQHTRGKAMDFYIPGVKLDKLRAIAMKAQGGGVGYYPRSGSPFVHVDTGNVRAWPRMTRQQLLALFPNGETLHLPADGKPLQGYERALAKRQTSGTTAVAYLDNGSDKESRTGNQTVGGWLKRVFDADEAEDGAGTTAVATAVAATPAQPAAAAASGEPTVLVAIAEPAADPRLPKARPGESLLALAAAPAEAMPVAPDQAAISLDQSMTSLALAPLPRNRPDSALLLASLSNVDNGTTALSIDADAIAALAALNDGTAAADGAAAAGGAVAAEEVTAETRMAAALSEGDVETALPSAADSAILAGFAALEEPQPVPSALTALAAAAALGEAKAASATPRARPVALAFTGTDLVPAAEATPEPAVRAAPAAEQGMVVALNLPSPEPEPAYQGDAAALIEMIATPAMHDQAYVRLAMPQPASADLFTPPDSTAAATSSFGGAALPTDRFETSLRDDGPARESFFSRLFVSLVQ
jgi:uncharacterized protein YcbK (DUF882 family)